MHLNDEALLELNEAARLHLSQCDECQARANNLTLARKEFEQLPILPLASSNWDEIQKQYQKNVQSTQLIRTTQQLRYWKFGSFALAASLAAVLIWLPVQTYQIKTNSNKQHLAELIEQNSRLQQQLVTLDYNSMPVTKVSLLNADIQNLDQAIQQAYIQGANEQEKSNLWNARQKLMKRFIAESKSKSSKIFQI